MSPDTSVCAQVTKGLLCQRTALASTAVRQRSLKKIHHYEGRGPLTRHASCIMHHVWNFRMACISSSKACNLSSSILTRLGIILFASSASAGHRFAICAVSNCVNSGSLRKISRTADAESVVLNLAKVLTYSKVLLYTLM